MADSESAAVEKDETKEVSKVDDGTTTTTTTTTATTETPTEKDSSSKPIIKPNEKSENTESKQADSSSFEIVENDAATNVEADDADAVVVDKPEDDEEEDEESELSSSDEEEDLLTPDPQGWDITFKLAPYLDNHFILVMVDNLKQQKRLLQQQSSTLTGIPEEATSETKDNEQIPPDRKKPSISLIGEQLMTLYDDADLNKMEFELLSKTCMVDFQLEMTEDASSNMAQKRESLPQMREQVVKRLKQLETACGPLIDVIQDGQSPLDYIEETQFDIDLLLSYCKLRYEVGVYQHTDLLLQHYWSLTLDPVKKRHALWGMLSAQILQNKWDDALKTLMDIQKQLEQRSKRSDADAIRDQDGGEQEDIWNKIAKAQLEGNEAEVARLEELMKSDNTSEVGLGTITEATKTSETISRRHKHLRQTAAVMRDRAWVLHWSLLVYFNDKSSVLDSLLSDMSEIRNKNVIETMCPHLLRYYAAAVLIANKASISSYLNDVSDIIEAEKSHYRDPITEFVRLVTRTHNFEGASKMLVYAMDVVKCDFFLSYYQEYFLQYARTTFLYRYCRMYSRISVDSLSKLLLMEGMSKEDIQLWLIHAIREEESLRNQAKLDVVENVIYVYFEGTNPYQKMKDHIVQLNMRTMGLVESVDNRLQEIENKNNAD